MTILAVDNAADRLVIMQRLLRRLFPEDLILLENDPLAAGKYSFTHPVDILLAAMETRPMDGAKLSSFVRRTNPKALIFLIAPPETDMDSALWKSEVNDLLSWPMTEEAVLSAIKSAQKN